MPNPDYSPAPSPLHYQLFKSLQEEIHSGNFKQGDLIATEKSLMERFNVSSTTVRRAIQELVQKGYLYRKVGKGTFVRRPYVEEPAELLSSFFEQMEAQRIRPSSDILTLKPIEADRLISKNLQIPENSPLYLIKMLMRANEDPMAVLNSYWPLKIGETIAKYDLTAAGIFSVAEKFLGIKLSEAEGTLEAAAPSREEVLLLQMPKRTPVLVKEQVIYSADGYPINYYRITYRGDRYKFRIRAIRHPVQNVIANREVIAFSNPSNPGFTETV